MTNRNTNASAHPTRRRLLAASMPAAAAIALPAAATALTGLPIGSAGDPIFAAIEAVRSAREANSAAYQARRELEKESPDASHCPRFLAGSFRGEPLWVSSHDEMLDVLVKRFLALLHDRGLPYENALENSPERTWFEIEIERVKKEFDERACEEEKAKVWREESGFDRVRDANEASLSALEEAEQRLIATEPTTTAGLVALVDFTAEVGGDWWGIACEDVFRTVGVAVEKFIAA